MSFRFGDSFDHIGLASQLGRKWTLNNVAAPALVAGRFGGQALQMGAGTGSQLNKSFGIDFPTLIVGFAFKRTNSVLHRIIGFLDATSTQCSVYMQPDGRITVRNGQGGTQLAISTFVLPVNVWVCLEVKVTFSNTGSAEVRINGTTIITLASGDTTTTANSFANAMNLGSEAANGAVDQFDDVYVCDTAIIDATNPLNDFLGDVCYKTQYPTAPGVTTDFGVVGAASNFDAVNDVAPGDDTRYVFDDTVGQRDTYEISDLSVTDTIKVVNICHLARKTDTGTAKLKPVVVSGVTTDIAAVGALVLDSYSYIQTPKPLDPNTGLPWTAAGFNAVKIGQEFAIV